MRVEKERGRTDAGAIAPTVAARAGGPSLIGREDPLVEVEDALRQALAGRLQVVLVTGAAGLGKTRFAAEVLARHADEAVCLSGRSYRWGVTTSFGLWVEALDRHLRNRPEAEVRRLCGRSLPDLAALLKTAEAVGGRPDREPQRKDLLDGLVELFDRLSADRPVLVALDDAHLADTSSWEALRYLGRRLSGAPIGVLVTARPAELRQHAIAGEVLVGLEDDALLRRSVLEPLRRDQVARLAHEVLRAEPGTHATFVPDPLVSWLAERSMGHPLFIIGLLRALVAEGADFTAPRLERIPEGLRERVNLELKDLSADTRAVLETLAVVERRTEVADLEQITGLGPDELGLALEQLAAARLVTEHTQDTGLACEVAHPIVQDTVYEEIGAARRRALHRTVARTLSAAGRLGSAAGHYARAGGPGDDEAIEALCQAMAQAEARGLYQEALAALAALLEILPADDQRWRRVLEAMAWQPEWVLSHLAENDAGTAIAAMERIQANLSSAGDAARATTDLHLAASLSFGAGRLEEAERACHAAIAGFTTDGETERALLARNELAWIRGCREDLSEQAALAEDVLEAARGSGSLRPAVQAAGAGAYALGMVGRFREAEALYAQAIGLAEQAGDTYRVAWAEAQRGLELALAGSLSAAFASVEAALDHDPGAPDALAFEDLAHCQWLAGRLAEGVATVEQSAVRRPVRGSRRRAWGCALAARMHAEMGLRGKADAGLEQARATYGDGHILVWSCWPSWTEGFLAWQDDDLPAALAALDRTAARLRSLNASAYEGLALVDVAEVAFSAGDRARCEDAAGRLRGLAEGIGGGLHPPLARLVSAWDRLAAGDDEAAAEAAREAGRRLSAGGYELYHGSAQEALGRSLERTDRSGAVEALSWAAEVFEGCGAVWRRDRALARLARLGSRGRRAVAAVSGPASLTVREREVARLATKGFTAREIGEQLFIGRRTVESHLANAYLKLGVSSKRELILRADELAL